MKRPLIGILVTGLLLLVLACGNEADSEETEVELIDGDSVVVDVDAEPKAIELTAPELLGKWQLVNYRIGDLFIDPAEIDNPTREFTAEGQMILNTNVGDPQTVPYTYLDGVISSLQEGDQYVSHLSADSLILTESIDGSEVRYTFVKAK